MEINESMAASEAGFSIAEGRALSPVESRTDEAAQKAFGSTWGEFFQILMGQGPQELPKEVKISTRKPSEVIAYVNMALATRSTEAIPEEIIQEHTMIYIFMVIQMMHDGRSECNAAVGKAQEQWKLNKEKERLRGLMESSATTITKIAGICAMVAQVAPAVARLDAVRNGLNGAVAFFGQSHRITPSTVGSILKLAKDFSGNAVQKGNNMIQATQAINGGLTQAYQTEQQLKMQQLQKESERGSQASGDQQRGRQMFDQFLQSDKQTSMAAAQMGSGG